MRLIKVKVPEGRGEEVVRLAHASGISEVGLASQVVHSSDGRRERKDVLDIETSTAVAKRFLDALAEAPLSRARQVSYAVRDARAIVTPADDVSRLTLPTVEPAVDVYAGLWEFTHVTPSFVGRVLIAATLLSYGIAHDKTLPMAAGLLFMPAMPLLLGVAFGVVTGSWRLVGRALLAMAALLALTVGAGSVVGSLVESGGIQFTDFTPLVPSLALSAGIGVAVGLATTDDVGWRELIGLATASQFTFIPAWFGTALTAGFGEGGAEAALVRLAGFGLNTLAIMVTAGSVYAALRMRRGPLAQMEAPGAMRKSVLDDLTPEKIGAT